MWRAEPTMGKRGARQDRRDEQSSVFTALLCFTSWIAVELSSPLEGSRENRVNQSGSVALSTEAMRGPPWRNLLIIMALFTQKSYEPGGRGFESCRARHFSMTWRRKPSPHSCCGTLVEPLIHRSVRT